MSRFFKVLPSTSRIPAGARSQAFLSTDNWDDWFTYSTMYSLFVFDEHGEEFRAGSVKIGQVGMETGQRRPNIPEEFDELGDEFFSLGQDDSYYEELNKLGPEGRDRVLRALRDIALDEDRFVRSLSEKVTGVVAECASTAGGWRPSKHSPTAIGSAMADSTDSCCAGQNEPP